MKGNFLKRGAGVALALVLAFSCGGMALAQENVSSESDDEISVISDDGISLLADTVNWTTTCTGQKVSITVSSDTEQTYTFTSEDGADVSAVWISSSSSSDTDGDTTEITYKTTYAVTMDETGQHILDIVGNVTGGSTKYYLEVVDHTFTTTIIDPTCTEKGYTKYTCSRCGYSYESDETDALGHDWGDWEIEKEATVGENGEKIRTCSRCDETETEKYSVDTEALDELLSVADKLNAGDYTKESWNAFVAALDEANEVLENLDSTQEDLDNAMNNLQTAFEGLTEGLNGVCKAADGNWYYYVDGEIDDTYYGFGSNSNGDWYVEKGMVTFEKNDVLKDTTGAIGTKGDWYYVVGSKVKYEYTGVADYKNANGWWYIKDGKVDFSANTIAKNKNGWWYISGGKVDFSYNGFGDNSNGRWYCEGGKVTFAKNDVLKDTTGAIGTKGTWYYVVGSKVQTSYTGVANYKNANGWWYIKNGEVDFTYNGFGSNSNGNWYVENGKVTFSKNSVLKDTAGAIGTKGNWYYVVGSKVQTSYTGVADYKNANGWWYIKNGKVDFSANTVAKNKNGWWYVLGGKVQFDFTGLANYKNANGWWYIKDGKVDFTAHGVYKNKNGWWYVDGGKVNFNFNGIAENQNGTWYIKGGKVDFSYSGTVTAGGKTYTIKDGKVV